jgi:hypothetical protein
MNRKELKRTFRIKVSFNFGEISLVKRRARATGRNIARYIREVTLDKEIKLKQLTNEEKELYKAMVGIANNVNQIAKHYNQGVITHVELLKTHSTLREIIIKLIGSDRQNKNG